MKVSTVILIASLCVVMVTSEESLESRLKAALKSMLENGLENEAEGDLEMEARDSVARCESDTNSCDGHGTCIQSTFGRQYICSCDYGFRSNSHGGCSAVSLREVEYISNFARQVEVEMLIRNSLDACISDTNNCDDNGWCAMNSLSRFPVILFSCICNDGYTNNQYGGCSVAAKREFELKEDDLNEKNEYADQEERSMDLLHYLAELYKE